MRDAGHRTPDAGHRTTDIGHRTAKKAKIIYPPPRGVDINMYQEPTDMLEILNISLVDLNNWDTFLKVPSW